MLAEIISNGPRRSSIKIVKLEAGQMQMIPNAVGIRQQEQRLDEAFHGKPDYYSGPLQDVGTGFVLGMLDLQRASAEGRQVPDLIVVDPSLERTLVRAHEIAQSVFPRFDETADALHQILLLWHQENRPMAGEVHDALVVQSTTLGYWVFALPVLAPRPLFSMLTARGLPGFAGDKVGEELVMGLVRLRVGLVADRVDISAVERFWELIGHPLGKIR